MMIPNGDPMTRGSVLTAILACCIVSLGAVGWVAAREVRQARAELEQAEAARGEAVRRWQAAEVAMRTAREWSRATDDALTRFCSCGASYTFNPYEDIPAIGNWSCDACDDPASSAAALTWGASTEAVGTTDGAAGTLRVDDTPDGVDWATSAPWGEPEWTIGTNDARTEQGRYPIWLGRDRLAGEIGRVDSQIVVWDRHGKVAARLDAACGECGR